MMRYLNDIISPQSGITAAVLNKLLQLLDGLKGGPKESSDQVPVMYICPVYHYISDHPTYTKIRIYIYDKHINIYRYMINKYIYINVCI